MSASAQSNADTTKATTTDAKDTSGALKDQKPAAALEEDDEFEDFPVEDWTQEDTELPTGNAHLWEESWDDDDNNEDFSKQLKAELAKVSGDKKS